MNSNIWSNHQAPPDVLISKLNNLSKDQSYSNFINSLNNDNLNNTSLTYSDFNLPLELQGGLSNIQSRRPSFTADQIFNNNNNNFGYYNSNKDPGNYINNNMLNFKSRRPSIQNDHYVNQNPVKYNKQINSQSQNPNVVELENGLFLENGFIVTSPYLQSIYKSTQNYFCYKEALSLYEKLKNQYHSNGIINKIVINLKKLNNLFNLVKPLVLILTKSGKFEILSIPMNSNLKISQNDVVIIDGDRGKDLVYVLDGSLTLEMAILINYLKKRQHSRAINYEEAVILKNHNHGLSNTVEDLLIGNGILDEETQFQIPSKQILRFANFDEVNNLKFKLIEELKTFKTCLYKVNQNFELNKHLTILNSEYQFDQKKLTFYYKSDKRLDFRNLIKELFKIYKTRIWLCAVVNYDIDYKINLQVDELEKYENDCFHVKIFEKTFEELLNI